MGKKSKSKAGGGDPSRIPPLVTVTYNCQVCGKAGTSETRNLKGFIPPKTCSTECTTALIQKQAQGIIRETLGEAPDSGTIPQKMAVELVTAYGWMKEAEEGRMRALTITCKHCGKSASKFTHRTAVNDKGVSPYCSGDCKESSLHDLPPGVICRAPRKATHTTHEAAKQAAEEMTTRLLTKGDREGVQPYQCTCGNWHVGHHSKRVWLDAARTALNILTQKTEALSS